MPRRINISGPGSESSEQKFLFQWWRLYRRSVPGHPLMFAIPNGGARNAATGARLRAEGVEAGIPDIFLAAPRGGRAGLFIELKRQHGGRVEKSQKAAMAALEEAGYAVAVAHGWRAAAEAVEAYLGGSAAGIMGGEENEPA